MKDDLDPILAYLLEFNKTNPIEYYDRFVIPPRGLQEMLKNYKKFHLSREGEVEKHTPTVEEELYELLD